MSTAPNDRTEPTPREEPARVSEVDKPRWRPVREHSSTTDEGVDGAFASDATLRDELWRAENPGLSAMRGLLFAMLGSAVFAAVFAAIIWACVTYF